MIYTVTLNPSLDYAVTLPALRVGEVNRPEREALYPGGKGINVSIVLSRLGLPTVALGVAAGFTGRQLISLLDDCGCPHDFVTAAGSSRLSVKVYAQAETEINGRGPIITPAELLAVLSRLDGLTPQDTVVLAGSLPPDAPQDAYRRILEVCAAKKSKTAVDTTGRRLLDALSYRPFLIKPNLAELCGLMGCDNATEEQAADYAQRLRQKGAENVLVSLGGAGALLAADDGRVYRAAPPPGRVVATVGAGDSMVAGFLAACEQGLDRTQALRLAVAAGSATAYGEWLANAREIRALAGRVNVGCMER